jgi:hypothetical protein
MREAIMPCYSAPLAINGKRVTCDGANVARAANMG